MFGVYCHVYASSTSDCDFSIPVLYRVASQVALVVKNLTANVGNIGDVGSNPELGRFPGGGDGKPL